MLRQMDKQAQIANLGEIYADVMDYGDLEREKEKLEAERDGVSEKYQKESGQTDTGSAKDPRPHVGRTCTNG